MLLAAPSLALAQGARAPESVTVTGTRDRQVLENFVQSFAAPTYLIGKIGRWEDSICPVTVGLRPEAIKFITKRVRDVAAQTGAPVDRHASCTPNLQILFTSHPQVLLDHIRDNTPEVLGYYSNGAELKARATVTRPIQAWYMTATIDLHGYPVVDGKPTGFGVQIGGPNNFMPNAHVAIVTGNRTGDGLHATFYRVMVVVDPDKLVDYEMGSLADYIAMLSLTQLSSLDTCQQLPSIVNLLAAGCANKANALTENDFAYLRGLYKMGPDRNLRAQQDEIAYHMEQNLKGQP
jgi:hypothetical protein